MTFPQLFVASCILLVVIALDAAGIELFEWPQEKGKVYL